MAGGTVGFNTTSRNTGPDDLNFRGASFTAVGSEAGQFILGEGTAPALIADKIIVYAPTDVAAGGIAFLLPGTAFSGLLKTTNSSGVMTVAQAAAGTDYLSPAGSETVTNKTVDAASNTFQNWPVEIALACSDETTALTTGTAKVTFRAPFAFTLTGVRASVTTAPTGSTLIVDINEGGTTVLSTKLSIDASEKTSTTAASAAVISDSAIADDAEITIDIDQIGSTVAGAGLKVWLLGTRTV